DKSEQRVIEVLKRCYESLENEKSLIELELPEDESKLIRGFNFLSAKPILIALNIAEDDISRSDELLSEHSGFVRSGTRELAVLCGKIEMELVALDGDERAEFMADLGIGQAAMEQVIGKSYSLLGLISFLTQGEKEVRAWTIRQGATAQKAGGAIHSDIERGFIRAEVITYDDFIELKSEAAAKSAGKMRLEGKNYVVCDGDVILFRFNV
ncbi:MAG: DUF933 domain-containing protein, partial [candidate division Zixibacteria bacterium]